MADNKKRSRSDKAKDKYRKAERYKADKLQSQGNEQRISNIISHEAADKFKNKRRTGTEEHGSLGKQHYGDESTEGRSQTFKMDYKGQKMYTPESKPGGDPFATEDTIRPKSAAAKKEAKAQRHTKSRLSDNSKRRLMAERQHSIGESPSRKGYYDHERQAQSRLHKAQRKELSPKSKKNLGKHLSLRGQQEADYQSRTDRQAEREKYGEGSAVKLKKGKGLKSKPAKLQSRKYDNNFYKEGE